MKPLQINTISDQVVLFMRQKCYNEILLAKELDVSPQTISRLIHTDDWHIDQIRALKRIFASRGVKLVGEVKQEVKIKRNGIQ